MKKYCWTCGIEIINHANYCSDNCCANYVIDFSDALEKLSNNLPIKCGSAYSIFLEFEDGNHKDYKFPVVVEYIEPEPEQYFGLIGEDGVVSSSSPEEIEDSKYETHAVIYSNEEIVLTLYECCYAIWDIKSGKVILSNLHKKNQWKLTDESTERFQKEIQK